jgi:hypothetical protein
VFGEFTPPNDEIPDAYSERPGIVVNAECSWTSYPIGVDAQDDLSVTIYTLGGNGSRNDL